MNWIYFPYFAYSAMFLWLLSVLVQLPNWNKKQSYILGNLFALVGTAILATFIYLLWSELERPPMRTLGETRLLYAFFLPFIGLIIYIRWRYLWFLAYTLGMAALFVLINLAHPEAYSKTLMPALQSPWFVPHVVVYIFSYALLAASSLVALRGLQMVYPESLPSKFFNLISSFANKRFNLTSKDTTSNEIELQKTLNLADNLVYIGFGFLTLGLLFGALWAKEAWGHYWTWDPKETWAYLTFLAYLVYMHYRYFYSKQITIHLWILALSFGVLLIAWFGVNYLPSASQSVHTYSN